jgi:hypothetical protein
MKQTLKQAAEQFEQSYVQSDGILTDAQKFEAGAQWQKEQGNIQWFEVAKGELPPIIKGTIKSSELLLLLPGNRTHIGEYYDNGEKTWWLTSGGFCNPTHYAFINLPE